MDQRDENIDDEHDFTLNLKSKDLTQQNDAIDMIDSRNMMQQTNNLSNQISESNSPAAGTEQMVQFSDEPSFKKSVSNPKLKLDMVRVSRQKLNDEKLMNMKMNNDLMETSQTNNPQQQMKSTIPLTPISPETSALSQETQIVLQTKKQESYQKQLFQNQRLNRNSNVFMDIQEGMRPQVRRSRTNDAIKRRVLPNGDVYIQDREMNVTGFVKLGVTGDYNNLRGNEQMGIEVQGLTLQASKSVSNGISIQRQYVNKSPMGNKIRKQSIARAQKLIQSRESAEFKDKDKKVNQYPLTRGDANEPCFHCMAKRIRASNVEKIETLKIAKVANSREELPLNIVALEPDQEGASPERCLYLDKVGNKDMDVTGKTDQNYQALETMKQEIISKEEELVAIGDAQKMTAEDMQIIQKIIKLDTQSKLQKSELSKYRMSPIHSQSPKNKMYKGLRGQEVSNQRASKKLHLKESPRGLVNKTPGCDSNFISDARNSLEKMPDAAKNSGAVTRIVLQSNVNYNNKFEVIQDSQQLQMPSEQLIGNEQTSSKLAGAQLEQGAALKALTNLKNFSAFTKFQQAAFDFMASVVQSKPEQESLYQVFKAMDVNEQGALSRENVKSGFLQIIGQTLKEQELGVMFAKVDASGDVGMNKDQFMVAAMDKKNLLNDSNIKTAFKMLDEHDRGYISIEEVQQILSLGGKAISEIKEQIDGKDEGKITLEQFQKLMKQNTELIESIAEDTQNELIPKLDEYNSHTKLFNQKSTKALVSNQDSLDDITKGPEEPHKDLKEQDSGQSQRNQGEYDTDNFIHNPIRQSPIVVFPNKEDTGLTQTKEALSVSDIDKYNERKMQETLRQSASPNPMTQVDDQNINNLDVEIKDFMQVNEESNLENILIDQTEFQLQRDIEDQQKISNQLDQLHGAAKPEQEIISAEDLQEHIKDYKQRASRSKSKFYSASNPINQQAKKQSFIFNGKVQFADGIDKSVTERNRNYLESNLDKYNKSILYSNKGRNLKLVQTQIQKNGNFDNMLQKQQKVNKEVALKKDGSAVRLHANQQTTISRKINAQKPRLTSSKPKAQTGRNNQVTKTMNSGGANSRQMLYGKTIQSQNKPGDSEISEPSNDKGFDKNLPVKCPIGGWEFYAAQQEEFTLSQDTKSKKIIDEDNVNYLGWFEEGVRKNQLHQKVDNLALEQEIHDVQQVSKYYAEENLNAAGAFTDLQSKLNYKVTNAGIRDSHNILSVRSSAKVGKNTLRTLVRSSKESTLRPGSAVPNKPDDMHPVERFSKNQRFGQKLSRTIMSGTVKPHHKDEQVQLAHPNKHSGYYDKLFHPGPLDPKTKTHTQRIQVKKYTYDEWARDILSPSDASRVKQKNLNRVPQFKHRQLETQLHAINQRLEKRMFRNNMHLLTSSETLQKQNQSNGSDLQQGLVPVRNPLPKFFDRMGDKDQYSMTKFLSSMKREDEEEKSKEQKIQSHKDNKDSIDIDSPQYMQQQYAEQQRRLKGERDRIKAEMERKENEKMAEMPEELQRLRQKQQLYEKLMAEEEQRKLDEAQNQKKKQSAIDFERKYGMAVLTQLEKNGSLNDTNEDDDRHTRISSANQGVSSALLKDPPKTATSRQSELQGSQQLEPSRVQKLLMKNKQGSASAGGLNTRGLSKDGTHTRSEYIPKREGHNFYKQQQLALLIPGYVDFILK